MKASAKTAEKEEDYAAIDQRILGNDKFIEDDAEKIELRCPEGTGQERI